MTRNTAIGLAAAASLTLAGLTPALADVSACAKQPNAETCPTMGVPSILSPSKQSERGAHKGVKHTRYHPGQSPKQSPYNG